MAKVNSTGTAFVYCGYIGGENDDSAEGIVVNSAGNAYVVGRRSDDSLYDRTLATYDSDDAYDHAAAVGFIEIFGLPLRTEAARHDSAWTWTEPMLGELPVSVTDG